MQTSNHILHRAATVDSAKQDLASCESITGMQPSGEVDGAIIKPDRQPTHLSATSLAKKEAMRKYCMHWIALPEDCSINKERLRLGSTAWHQRTNDAPRVGVEC